MFYINYCLSSSLKHYHLCSGIKPVDKREGGGSHNWGTIEDEIKGGEDAQDKANTSGSAGPNAGEEGGNAEGAPKEGGENKNEESAEPREEEPKTFTLVSLMKLL